MNAVAVALDNLHEAARRVSKQRQIANPQADLEKAMRKAFVAHGNALMSQFAERKSRWPVVESIFSVSRYMALWEAVNQGDLDKMFDAADDETFELFLEPIQDTAALCLMRGAAGMMAVLDQKDPFTLKNPRARAYLLEHGAALVKNINETTRAEIRAIITAAMDDGWSYAKTAEAIQSKYQDFSIGKPQEHIDSRAHLVAVTEAGEAYEAGGYAVVQNLSDAGITVEKRWVTMGDDRVSDECLANQADGWIGIDDTHTSGHQHPLRFPGCRCDEEYRTVIGGKNAD